MGVCYSSVLSYHFTRAFLGIKNKKWILYLFYFISTIFLFLNLFTNKLISGFYIYQWGYFPKAGKYHTYFMAYIFFETGYTLYLLYKRYRQRNKLAALEFERVKYIFFAFAIGHLVLINFCSTYGMPVYPNAHLYMAILFVMVAYAIIHHQLFNIEFVLKKTLVYSIIISIITILYFIIIYMAEKVFSIITGHHSIPLAIATIAFFSIIFIPLKNKIQQFIDNRFFHGTIEQIDEENIKLREELQKTEKLKAVATLAAGMAHEIKNPLTSIKTFTEFIDKKKDDPEFIEKFKKIVGDEVDRINYIVKQLLEFSKPSELKLQKTNINELLDETLNLLYNDCLKHSIKIEKNYCLSPMIRIDPTQMKQVFLNLLLNTIDAMPDGGTVIVSTKITNNTLQIIVKDTGKGIDKDDIKHIFDPFFSKKDGGTGLGLSVVHGIIEKHGGKISVGSIVNKGSSFIITLPLK